MTARQALMFLIFMGLVGFVCLRFVFPVLYEGGFGTGRGGAEGGGDVVLQESEAGTKAPVSRVTLKSVSGSVAPKPKGSPLPAPESKKTPRPEKVVQAPVVKVKPSRPRQDDEAVLELPGWSTFVENGQIITEGKVKNISPKPLTNVVIEAQYKDVSGNFIASDTAYTEYETIEPGQVSPFRLFTAYRRGMENVVLNFKTESGVALPVREE